MYSIHIKDFIVLYIMYLFNKNIWSMNLYRMGSIYRQIIIEIFNQYQLFLVF